MPIPMEGDHYLLKIEAMVLGGNGLMIHHHKDTVTDPIDTVTEPLDTVTNISELKR